MSRLRFVLDKELGCVPTQEGTLGISQQTRCSEFFPKEIKLRDSDISHYYILSVDVNYNLTC